VVNELHDPFDFLYTNYCLNKLSGCIRPIDFKSILIIPEGSILTFKRLSKKLIESMIGIIHDKYLLLCIVKGDFHLESTDK